MLARRLTALTILVAFATLAILSFLGDRVLSSIFIVVAGVVLGHHAVRLCPHCSNHACAFNPRAREEPPARDGGDVACSSLAINRTTVLPLLLTGPLAVIASWRFSPALTIAWAVVAISAHSVFRELTCKHCGNICAGNCNPAYRGKKFAL